MSGNIFLVSFNACCSNEFHSSSLPLDDEGSDRQLVKLECVRCTFVLPSEF